MGFLQHAGIECSGWDPAFRPDAEVRDADIVNLGYVINVIENPAERESTLQAAWRLARQLLIVAARLEFEVKGRVFEEFGDGIVTKKGTFQKFYTQTELREWIDNTLRVESIPAAPGIFLVFRDEELRQTYLAKRFRRTLSVPTTRVADVLFEQHRELLDPLMAFVSERGRLPEPEELPNSEAIAEHVGSIRRAFAIVRRVTGSGRWDAIETERRRDLLIYLALDRFHGRPPFGRLPRTLQLDIRSFFRAYKSACKEADELLFAAGDLDRVNDICRKATVGKLTPEALYVHITSVDQLPPLLRVYEGCARNYIGQVDDANIVKLHREKPQISYMFYPDFDTNPHPALEGLFKVKLGALDIFYRDFNHHENPPILHRKELFVTEDYPGRAKFAKLTRQEERSGLFEDAAGIGHREQWEERLRDRGVRLRGHRLERIKAVAASS